MWIFRVDEPRLGVIRIREWRRRALHTVGLLVMLLGGATIGLIALDQSSHSFPDTLLTHTLDPSRPIAVPGENPLRKALLENAGATSVIIAGDVIAKARVTRFATAAEAAR